MIKRFGDGRDWFFKEKLGMFIHWGIYSQTKWQEQVLWRNRLKRKDYEVLKDSFNPIEYDPEKWLDLAESAGMTFIVFTAKHHDGFCMYDTNYTDYNITNTPYGKDVLKMLSDACKKRGIKLGIYYSLPDWNHSNYPNLGRHHEMQGQRDGEIVDEAKYLEFVRNQVTELCTNYGEICEFFWDVNVAEFYDPSLNELLRKLQPNIVINDRGPSEGDFTTPERRVPNGLAFSKPTQACQSLGRESWGYRENEDYYTTEHIISSIDKIIAMGGSYLLNVGPCPDGTIDSAYWDTFEKIGKWYSKVCESFDGTYPASYMIEPNIMPVSGKNVVQDEVLLTRKDNTLYVHFSSSPQTKGALLKPLEILPESAIVLNNSQEIECEVELLPWTWTQRPYLHLKNLPVEEMGHEAMVVKLVYSNETFS